MAQMKPNRPLFLQSKQVLAVQDQKVSNKMLISTGMHEISIAFYISTDRNWF